MSPRQSKALINYINKLKSAMWLGQWNIEIMDDGDIDPDTFAAIDLVFGQRSATLRVCNDFFSFSPAKQRRILTHELFHCYSADVQKQGEGLRKILGTVAHDAWFFGFTLAVEHMVEALSVFVAHENSTLLPLPKLPK